MVTPCVGCGALVPVGSGGRCARCRAPARRIRSGLAWRDLSAAVRSAGQCARCGRRLPPAQLDAGHIIPASRRPDLALDPRNVQAVCRACNPRGPRQ